MGFQSQFAAAVESGEKTQTIRATRVYPIEKGDRLFLWTGLRTTQARKLGEGIVESAAPITIREGTLPRPAGPIIPRIDVQGPRGAWRRLHRRWPHLRCDRAAYIAPMAGPRITVAGR